MSKKAGPVVEDDDDKKKRRGRKPKDKFAFDDIATDKPSTIGEPDNNIIIKIPISCMELNKEFNLSDSIPKLPSYPIQRIQQDMRGCYGSDISLSHNPGVNCSASAVSRFIDHTTPTANDALHNLAYASHFLVGSENPENKDHHKLDNWAGQSNWAGPKPFEKNESIDPFSYITNDNVSHHISTEQSKINEMLTDIVEPANKRMQTQVEILLEKKYKHTKQLALFDNLCNSWPKKSEKACFWDCHMFDHQPWGIPIKYCYSSGQFTLFGNFCSPNCVAAHILATETNTAALWERLSLLNLLYYRVYETDDNIIPAPDKLCLKLFGGPLDINEFRALTLKNNKIYTLNFPPCNTILPVLEETKKVANQDSYFIPADKKKQNKVQTELKIKRTRSITSNKNTLDNLIMSAENGGGD
jgi:hypothetical protein